MAKSLIAKHEFGGRNSPALSDYADFGGPNDFTLDNSRGIKPGIENKSLLSANSKGVIPDRHIPGELEDELNGVNSENDLPKDFSDYGGPKGLSETAGDKFGDLTKAAPDPREVLSNVIGYLHDNGLGDVGHAVFNYVLPRLASGIGATGVATNKIDGGDMYKTMSDAPIADLATQTKDAFSPEDNIDTSSTSDIADRATSGLEAPTVDVSDRSATTPAKNVSSSPTHLKTASNEHPMSDEDIHAWNLAHNPNYDPSVFDEHTGSFNYNKGNQ